MDKEIYEVGGRRYDPLRVLRKLHESMKTRGADMESCGLLIEMGGPQADAESNLLAMGAMGMIALAACDAFGVKHIDDDQQDGLSERQLFTIVSDFLAWVGRETKKGKPSSSA